MSEHGARVVWHRDGQRFTDNRYSRAHRWEFDGGAKVEASASPHVVPEPMSVAGNVDPEEAFVAALSSCHMLFFLSIASGRGFVVERYVDEAVGVMAENEEGRMAMTRVALRPLVDFTGARPDRDQLAAMHHRAHELCFIANSVKTTVETLLGTGNDA